MKLPGLGILKKEKVKPAYFLAFILRDEKAIAIIFEELGGQAKIIGQGEEVFEKSIEDASEEELLTVSDRAISKAEEVLPEGVETQKTIFGLKDSWIEEEKIKKEYLDKLKKISDELGLTPIGFLQTSEAILNLLKNEEGAPVTALLAEFSKKFVIVSAVKTGRIVESKGAEIAETEATTVDNLLKHFQALEILPSRILLFGNKSDELLQQFLSHQWSKSLNFLHLPQAIALPNDLDVKGVLFGAAAQLGFSVMADFVKQEVKEEMPKNEELIIEAFEKQEKIAESLNETLEDSISKEELPEGEKIEEGKQPIEQVSAEFFGFMEGDIAKTKPEPQNFQEIKEEPVEVAQHALEIEETEEAEETPEASPKLKAGDAFLKPVLAFGKKIPAFFARFKGKKIIIIPGAIIILAVILYVVYLFSLKATVLLTLDPKSQEQTQNITFSQSSSTNPDKNIIAANLTSITEDGTSQTPATGKKDIGTYAKGSVTICSRFTGEKTLPVGTLITSSNNLIFSTDSAIDIASASADASADCSKANTSVTAKQYGKEYNLPSGTKFTVGDFDSGDIIAKNDDPFTGGVKNEITVISKDDLAKAQTDLIKSLENKAQTDLEQKISKDELLLPGLIDAKVTDSTPNKKVGDQASSLNLAGTVSYTGVVYAKSDLTNFTKGLFKDKLSSDQVISDSSISVTTSNVKQNNDEISADLKIKVNFLPKIDDKQIAQKVAGLSQDNAISELSKLPQIADVRITISPNIPFLSKYLPRASGNISVFTKN